MSKNHYLEKREKMRAALAKLNEKHDFKEGSFVCRKDSMHQNDTNLQIVVRVIPEREAIEVAYLSREGHLSELKIEEARFYEPHVEGV